VVTVNFVALTSWLWCCNVLFTGDYLTMKRKQQLSIVKQDCHRYRKKHRQVTMKIHHQSVGRMMTLAAVLGHSRVVRPSRHSPATPWPRLLCPETTNSLFLMICLRR